MSLASHAWLADPAITALGAKMRHKVHVELHLRDGTVMRRTVEAARGSEKQFATDAEIHEKFGKLAGKVLSAARIGELRDAVMHIDELPDAAVLAQAASAVAFRSAHLSTAA